MDNKDFKDGDNGGFSNMGQTILIILIAATVTFFIYSLAQRFTGRGMNQELSYSRFLSMVDRNLVDKVEWGDGQITVYPKAVSKNVDGAAEGKESGGEEKGSLTNRAQRGSALRPSLLVYERHGEANGRQWRRHHGCRKVQCQDVYAKGNRNQL